jgi:hypothetical protein
MLNLGTLNSTAPAANGGAREWFTLSCPRCGGAVLLEGVGGNRLGILRQVPDADRNLVVSHLPPDVERYYSEAITCLEAGVPDAAAVQLRRTLEAAAAHFDVKPSPLVNAIEELIKKGLITASSRRR